MWKCFCCGKALTVCVNDGSVGLGPLSQFSALGQPEQNLQTDVRVENAAKREPNKDLRRQAPKKEPTSPKVPITTPRPSANRTKMRFISDIYQNRE